jgi:formylglycine-generating enzyme required for sulfatase activity
VTPFPIEKRNNPNIVSETKTNFFNRRSPSGLMVKISAGRFLMGSNDGLDNEKPVHTVYVDAFYIDIYEVTNAQYREFIQATRHPEPEYWNNSNYNQPNQPVVGVTWHDAMAYAQWAGKRLPTEAEWEKAARGGLKGKRYPWGDNISHDDANYLGTGGRDTWAITAPVGSFPPNGYGIYDMAGNVWEWCLDEYQADFYSKSPRTSTNPIAGESILYVIKNFANVKSWRVLRGGSWLDYNNYVRVAIRIRITPDSRFAAFGFRCVSAR